VSATGLAELVEDGIAGGGINPGTGSYLSELTNVGGTLFFSANDGTNGYELWRFNTTSGLAELVQNINPGAASSDPRYLTNIGGKLFFSAIDGTNGRELWRINDSGAAELVD